MPARSGRTFAHLASLILRFGPPAFRDRFGPDLTLSFARMLDDERRRRGRVAAWVLGFRGLIDTGRAVRGERHLASSRGPGPFRDLGGDLRDAWRGWVRAPGFALTVVATLTLGIGLASAIFAFADGYLFRALPLTNADRLFFVSDPDASIASALKASETVALRRSAVKQFGFAEWGGQTDVPALAELVAGDRHVPIRVEGVSQGFAETLHLPFAAGRAFGEQDYGHPQPVPIWLSFRLWQREFGGDRGVLNRVLTVIGPRGDVSVRVVGIMDRRITAFDLNNPPPDVVAPSPDPVNPRPNLLSFPIVRLPDGVDRARAESMVGSALQGIAPAPAGRVRRVRLSSLYEYEVRGGRPTARVFLAGAVLILLLVTANLVHLLLTRGVARQAEIATRLALGASRWRVARAFLVESFLLAGVGLAGGLALGAALTGRIAAAIPQFPTGARNLSLVVMGFDLRVVTFAVVTTLVVALAGGVWPASRAARQRLAGGFHTASAGAGRVSSRTAQAMMASQLAMATVIMAGTAYMSIGIWRYLNRPLGFAVADRFSVSVLPPPSMPDDPTVRWDDVLDAIRSAPGVRAASVYSARNAGPIRTDRGEINDRSVGSAQVVSGFFTAWGMQPARGRLFGQHEIATNASVAVVEDTFASHVWPGQDPMGQTVGIGDGPPRQVIGVVPHARHRLSLETPGLAYVPVPALDHRESLIVWAPGLTADDLMPRLRVAVADAAHGYHVEGESLSFDRLFLRDTGEAYFQRPVVVTFGSFALLLAGIGLFGLVAYLVERRLRDFGIRLALGARPSDIWADVLRQSVMPAVAGLLVGLVVARMLAGLIRSTVFGWESSGTATVVFVSAALLAVALAAAVRPARRAMHVDPVTVLRAE